MDPSRLILITVGLVAVGFLQLVTSLSVPLDMAPQAVDDMYDGCSEKMEKKVKDVYFNKENKKLFKVSWGQAKHCANKPHPEDEALSKNNMQAICAYSNIIFKEFSAAVRTSKNFYGSSFPFHSLHFWLTTAIQIMKTKQGCHITYRRTGIEFTGTVNSIIRFGMFASSSKRKDLTQFGDETCFEIETCSGAYLKDYPVRGTDEEEVLIPPYETFKITQIYEGKGKFKPLPDCKKVFILKSQRNNVSNLNCKVAN